jgi:hypothetical protein
VEVGGRERHRKIGMTRDPHGIGKGKIELITTISTTTKKTERGKQNTEKK